MTRLSLVAGLVMALLSVASPAPSVASPRARETSSTPVKLGHAPRSSVRPQDGYRCDRDAATFYEHGIYSGASWTLYMCYDPGYPYEWWSNTPPGQNDVASAICMHSSFHKGWQLTANLYAGANRNGFMRSYTVTSNGSGEHCYNFSSAVNDRLSSAGLVWTRP